LSCLFALFTPGYWCGRSCGERYWGDFYSDPPDCWDPCDRHGNYMGGGCRNCGGNGGNGGGYVNGRAADAMPSSEENIVSQSDRVVGPAPRPAAQPHKAAKPYGQ
jgi:hypothetical protein